MKENSEKVAAANSGMPLNRGGLLLLLVVFCELLVTLLMIHDQRMPRGHDGFFYYCLQYYFLNNAVTAGETPQWMPFLTQGIVGNWWYMFSGSITQNAFLLVGGFLKGINFLPIFHLGIVFDELVLMIGVWLLAGRWFESSLTRCFTTATALGSTIWMSQPNLNLRFVYALPLILYFLHLFLDRGKWRHAFLGVNLLAIQLLGGGIYSFPVVSMVIFAYFLSHGLLFFPESCRKIRAIRWNWTAAVWIVFSVASFLLVYFFKVTGTEGIVLNSTRNPDCSVPLYTFLTYGGRITPEQWGEQLFQGAAHQLDCSLYSGYLLVPFLILGMACNRRRQIFVIMAVTALLVLFSLGGLISTLCYHLWPTMKYYRHIAQVAPITKLFLCFLAGFGFETLAAPAPPVHVFRVNRAGLIAAGSGLLISILILADEYYRFFIGSTLGMWASCIALLLGAFAPIRGSIRSVLAALVLVLHLLDLYSYKIQMVGLKTLPLNEAQYRVNAFTPMPYAKRRDLDYLSNPRLAVFKSDLLETPYGALYAVMNSYFFLDTSRSPYRVDYWLQPLDDFMNTYWQQPIHPSGVPPMNVKYKKIPYHMDFPLNHAGSLKFAGITEDKIQIFSGAYSIDSDDRLSRLLASPDYAGDILFVSVPNQNTNFPAPPRWQTGASLCSNTRLPVRYEVLRFDADHLEVAVDVDPHSVGPDGAWFFYSDVWHPFWKATVNGHPVPVYKANLAYKAVPIPFGKSVVHFSFQSRTIAFLLLFIGLNSTLWIGIVLWLFAENCGLFIVGRPTQGLNLGEKFPEACLPMASGGRQKIKAASGVLLILVMLGCCFNFRNDLLIAAAGKGHTTLVKILTYLGADPDAKDSEGITALMFAAMEGRTESVRALLARGSNVNATTKTGSTALMFAAGTDHAPAAWYAAIVQALLKNGANLEVEDDSGTAIWYASKNFHRTIVDILLQAILDQGLNVNTRDKRGISPLLYAVQTGNADILQKLLEKGANANLRFGIGTTPLMFAAKWNYGAVVNVLLKGGADVNATTDKGATALMCAGENGHAAVVQALLDKSAKVNARQTDGVTALMLATQNGHKPVIKTLIARGADVNMQDIKGLTPLKIAQMNENKDLVDLLKKCGAKINPHSP